MKKKTVISTLLLAILAIFSISVSSQEVSAAKAITLKATTTKKIYTAKPGYKSAAFWDGGKTHADNVKLTHKVKLNHGKFYLYVPMTFTVNSKGTKLVYDTNKYTDKKGTSYFKKGNIYVYRFPTHVSGLKANTKYRFRTITSTKNSNSQKMHWVTKKTNSKGILEFGPYVDVYVNCGAKKSLVNKVLKNKTKISNSRVKIL